MPRVEEVYYHFNSVVSAVDSEFAEYKNHTVYSRGNLPQDIVVLSRETCSAMVGAAEAQYEMMPQGMPPCVKQVQKALDAMARFE